MPSLGYIRNISSGMRLTATSQLIINLLLKQNHLLACQLLQCTQDPLAAEQTIESGVGVCMVFCSAEDAFALSIYFLFPASARLLCRLEKEVTS